MGYASKSEDLAPVLDIIVSHIRSDHTVVDLRKFFKHGSIWNTYSHVRLEENGTIVNTPQSIPQKQLERTIPEPSYEIHRDASHRHIVIE